MDDNKGDVAFTTCQINFPISCISVNGVSESKIKKKEKNSEKQVNSYEKSQFSSIKRIN